MRRSLLWLCLLATCTPGAAAGKPLTDIERILLRVKPAVVYVQVQVRGKVAWTESPGQIETSDPVGYSATGSGFLVHPDGYLVTNGHVVADLQASPEELQKRLVQQFFLGSYFPRFIRAQTHNTAIDPSFASAAVDKAKVFGLWAQRARPQVVEFSRTLVAATANRKVYPAEIKKFSPPIPSGGKDIAVLKLEGKNFPTIALGDSDRVRLQDPVYPVGFPGVATNHPFLSDKTILEASITSGHVSALKQDLKGTPVIQIDAAITHGNSGGPAIDKDGAVIGVSTFGSVDAAGQEIGGFNFLVPINTAREFVGETGTAPRRGLFDELWQEAIELFHDGKHHAAMAKLDEVLRFQPDLPDARRLQQEAQTEISQHPVAAFFESTTLRATLILVPLLALGALAFVLWRRRRAAPRRAPGKTPVTVEAKEVPPAPPLRPPVAATILPSSLGRRLVLEHESGPARCEAVTVLAAVVIGRDPDRAQVLIDDPGISRAHVRIEPTDDGFVAVCLAERNPMQINGREQPRWNLADGDLLKLGSTVLRIRLQA